ncbi:MAG TPA: hypothetical protein VFR87_19335 [Nocardioidaceae bacterium]|nr:hypothetical protein [Nocardioidaceae bacterium]
MLSKSAVMFAFAVAVGVSVAGPSPSPLGDTVSGDWSSLKPVRYTELSDVGIHGAAGLAWSEQLKALVTTETADNAARLSAFTPDDYRAGSAALPPDITNGHVAVDPDTGAVTVLGQEGAYSVEPATIRAGSKQMPRPAGEVPDVSGPQGTAYDASGRLIVLADGELVTSDASGATDRAMTGLEGHDLRGLATHPDTGQLYTFDMTADRLVELGQDGQVLASIDASGVELEDVTGLAFAPSADSTDEPSVTHLYVADAGKPGAAGVVWETSIEPAGLTTSYTVSSAQVRSVATSAYNPPSPDPSGVTYIPDQDRLLIVDGEVEEMTIYQGSNVFVTDRPGVLRDKGDTQPWSKEPTGSGYNPATKRLYVSDDSKRDVHEVSAGGDGRFGTGDDVVSSFDTAGVGNTDPEGLDFDTATNSVWVVDGIDKEVFRYRPGTDGRFGTTDDIRSQFDIGKYGAGDPEGLAYDSGRDTIAVIDSSSRTIYELDKSGGLLNTIDISAANMRAAAGLTLGPSTSGSVRSYYAVARGVDNDSNPNENDGVLYELQVDLGGGSAPQNTPPTVDAGADQTVVLPSAGSLDGTVQDDGLPVPPGDVTSTWEQVSGPDGVVFADSTSPTTTATFPSQGTFVLRLTATDGAATSADELTVTVLPAGSDTDAQVVETRVSAGSDDVEQRLSGWATLVSSDLELTTDGTREQVVGLRFAGLQVPQGATVTTAYLQFRADEVSTGAAALSVKAEASDNAPTYTNTSGNVTARATTSASVAWSPPDWLVVGESGARQRTPDLSSLVQAVVSRSGWAKGNALALQVSGTGRRTAEAFEGGPSVAPLLHVEFTAADGGGGTTNAAPTVDAGPDRSVTLPNTLTLEATVTDDGLPGAGLTHTWSQVSGPGTATFSPADAEDTTASFTTAGTYVLRLTADDGELSGSDEVTVSVAAQPSGGGGTQTLDVRVAAGSDDAEQRLTGSTSLTSSDLELTTDGTTQQVVGLRFAGLQIPAGSTVTNAYVQFRTNEVSTGAVSLTIRAEAADNAATYAATSGNVTSRATTAVGVAWSPPDWSVKGEAAAAQRTPDLTALIQAVVSRTGWVQGNALALQVSGTGRRTADAFEYGAAFAPLLHVEYTTG